MAATITAVETRFEAGGRHAAAVPRGYVLRQVGETTEVARADLQHGAKPSGCGASSPGPRSSRSRRRRCRNGSRSPRWRPPAAGWDWRRSSAAISGARTPGLTRALYLAALIAGGWDAAKDTWKNLRSAKLDIHFLMLAVAAGAMAIGAWGEATLLLFLFSASGAMEEFALDRTHREVSALLKASPKQATLVLPDGGQRLVPIEEVGLGDRVLVKPGELFPADGDVAKGKTASDESTLTGEAQPVEKGPGEPVFSGTLNLWGAVEVDRAAPAGREHAAEDHPADPDRAEAQGAERAVHRQVRREVHLARARSDRGDVLRVVAGLPPAAVREHGGTHLGLLPRHDAAGRGQPVRAGAVDPVGHPRRHRLGRAQRHPVSRRRGHRKAGARSTSWRSTRPAR